MDVYGMPGNMRIRVWHLYIQYFWHSRNVLTEAVTIFCDLNLRLLLSIPCPREKSSSFEVGPWLNDNRCLKIAGTLSKSQSKKARNNQHGRKGEKATTTR